MALVAVALYLLRRDGSFIVPSVIGIVLATTLSPVVGWLERRRVPRLLGAVIIALVVVLLLILFAWALVVIVVDQGPQIWHTLTQAGARIDRWLGGSGTAGDTLARLEKVIGGLRQGAAHVMPLALKGAPATSTTWSSRSSWPPASASSSSGRVRWRGAGSRDT